MRHTDGIIYYCEFVLENSPNIMLGVCNYDADPYKGISPPPPLLQFMHNKGHLTHYNSPTTQYIQVGVGWVLI